MEDDWKKYWRNNNKKERKYSMKIFILLLTLLIAGAIITKDKYIPLFQNKDQYISFEDNQFLSLTKDTDKELENLLEYCRFNNNDTIDISKFKNYKALVNNLTEIINSNYKGKDIKYTKNYIVKYYENIQPILNNKVISNSNYITLVNLYNNYVSDFLNIFEDELKSNEKKYIRNDKEIIYYTKVNP